MRKFKEKDYYDYLKWLIENLLKEDIDAHDIIERKTQLPLRDQENTIFCSYCEDGEIGKDFWMDVYNYLQGNDEGAYRDFPLMGCEDTLTFEGGPVAALPDITPAREDDIRNEVYRNIVKCAAKLFEFDERGLSDIRTLMFSLNREEEVEVLGRALHKLQKKEFYIGGDYIENQLVNEKKHERGKK